MSPDPQPPPRPPLPHPGWAILHTIAATLSIAAGTSFVLWVTASNFDATELKAIGGVTAISGGVVGVLVKILRS